MRKTITQGKLRNGRGKIARREFVPSADAMAAFALAPRLDAKRFHRDLDALIDRDPRPRR